MKKLLVKFVIWMMWKLFRDKKYSEAIRENIVEMYRMQAQADLVLKADIIPVKKGKRKYDLLIFDTKEGKRMFNLDTNLRFNPDEIIQGMI